MAKSAMKRDSEYRNKLDIDYWASKLKQKQADMANAYASVQADLTSVEEVARAVLSEFSVPSCFYPPYLNFTRQVWKAHRNLKGGTLKLEAQNLIDKWKARQLREDVLDEIRFRVFTVDKPAEKEQAPEEKS